MKITDAGGTAVPALVQAVTGSTDCTEVSVAALHAFYNAQQKSDAISQ
jgi:hypothetical protein